MPLSPPLPALAPLCALLLALGSAAAGCTTVAPSTDRARAAREPSAEQLRSAAVTDADLGPGYTVTVLKPGHGETAGGGGREASDLPVCQPLLDVMTPATGPSAGADGPYARTGLSVARAVDPRGSVYGGLLAFRGGRAAGLQGELEGLLGRCGSFTSTAPGPPSDGARKEVRARHRTSRHDTPTPGGADAATGFTLTNESGTVTLSQRAVLVRVGPVLVVFSTVGVGAERAADPDERIVRQQVARLRAVLTASG
ncbi:hypothetical protein ACWEQL_29200 [Kitasatospora sp. NPDC004240]